MSLTPAEILERFRAYCAAEGRTVRVEGEYVAIDEDGLRIRLGALVDHCQRVPPGEIEQVLRHHLDLMLRAADSMTASWSAVSDRTILASCSIHKANQLPMAFPEFIPLANGLLAAPCIENEHERQFPVVNHAGQPTGAALRAHAIQTLCDNLAIICRRLDRDLLEVQALFRQDPISPATLLALPQILIPTTSAALVEAEIAGDPILVAPNRDSLLLTGSASASGLRSLERHATILQRDDALPTLGVSVAGAALVPWVPPVGSQVGELRGLMLRDAAWDWDAWKRHLANDDTVYVPGVQVIGDGRGVVAFTYIATPAEIPLWVDFIVVPTTPDVEQEIAPGTAAIVPSAAFWADGDTWEPGRTPFSRRSLRSVNALNHLARQHPDFTRWMAGRGGDRSRN